MYILIDAINKCTINDTISILVDVLCRPICSLWVYEQSLPVVVEWDTLVREREMGGPRSHLGLVWSLFRRPGLPHLGPQYREIASKKETTEPIKKLMVANRGRMRP